jgi:hypothetical protein
MAGVSLLREACVLTVVSIGCSFVEVGWFENRDEFANHFMKHVFDSTATGV